MEICKDTTRDAVMKKQKKERSIRVIFYDKPAYRAEAEGIGPVEEGEQVQVLERLPLDEIEDDLKGLISVFENLEVGSGHYCIDEARATVGIARDQNGTIRGGLSVKILGLVGIDVGGEKGQRRTTNELIEITIKRKGEK
jgi:hypothetical protein